MTHVFQAILFHSGPKQETEEGWAALPWTQENIGLIKDPSISGEEQDRHIYSIPKAKERLMDRPSPEPERPPDTEPLESPQQEKEAAEQEWPVSEVQGRTRPGRDRRFVTQGVWRWV